MKNIIEYIKESKIKPWESDSGTFSDHFKYTRKDFDKFIKATENELSFHYTDGLCLVFREDDHIATYNPEKQEIYTDDSLLFGHEVKESLEDAYVVEVTTEKEGNRTMFAKNLQDAINKIPKNYINYAILKNSSWNFSEAEALVQWDGEKIYWAYKLDSKDTKDSEKEIIKNKIKSLK